MVAVEPLKKSSLVLLQVFASLQGDLGNKGFCGWCRRPRLRNFINKTAHRERLNEQNPFLETGASLRTFLQRLILWCLTPSVHHAFIFWVVSLLFGFKFCQPFLCLLLRHCLSLWFYGTLTDWLKNDFGGIFIDAPAGWRQLFGWTFLGKRTKKVFCFLLQPMRTTKLITTL